MALSLRAGIPGSLTLDRDLHLDLDRAAARQGCDTDCRARVPSALAEHLEEQPACAVDHGGLLVEVLQAGDEPEHAEHTLDTIECPELRAQHRQRVQRAPA